MSDRLFFGAGALISAWLILLLSGVAAGGAVHLLLVGGVVVFVKALRSRQA